MKEKNIILLELMFKLLLIIMRMNLRKLENMDNKKILRIICITWFVFICISLNMTAKANINKSPSHIGHYPKDNIVKSGWMFGEKHIRNKAAFNSLFYGSLIP